MHLLLQTDLSMAADNESAEEIYFRVSELKKELSNELFQIEQYTEMALEYFYFLQAEVSLYKQTGNYRISYLTVSGLFIPCFICRTLLLPG